MLSIEHLSLLILRLAFGSLMVWNHGLPKFRLLLEGIDSTPNLLLAVICELVCAGMITLGLLTRWVSVPLIFAMALGVYASMKSSLIETEVPILYLAVFAVLFLKGGGRWSLDHYVFKSRTKSGQW